MDMASAALLGAGFAAGAAAIGASIAVGQLTSKTIEGISRQPEAKGSLLPVMFIGVGLIEALPLLTWVIALLMVFTKA